ncbi:hypothetical protein SASPL_138229 [Salvia splendens]|uniref:Protein kinase domain-containing protein n=1 Tax=Salvia splendens TaxID=180675 RepID=A0A8X8WV35_SALSN|nr:hypothetical protein SASPL_138229 [Salvia splendens]
MAAALECWSSRTSTDEDIVEQVLMRTNDRSECLPENNSSSASSSSSSSSAAAAVRDSSAFQKRFQRLSRNVSEAIASLKNTLNLDSAREMPASQLPEKLVSNLRKHYDSLPLRFENELRFRLIDSYAQAGFEMKDVFLHIKLIEQAAAEDNPAIIIQEVSDEDTSADGAAFKLTFAWQEKMFKTRIENALRLASKKPKTTRLSSLSASVDAKRRALGGKNLGRSKRIVVVMGVTRVEERIRTRNFIEIGDQAGPGTFKGVYKGKKVRIEKLKGCDKGNAYEFEYDNHGLCIVTKLMEGGTAHDLIMKSKKIQIKEIIRSVSDVAEGIKFMNDHGIAYRDLNTQRILLDKRGNACLGDMGIVSACKSVGEAMEYETDGYRWLAPEMVTGEIAYSAYSPVQAAVGIAACGLRPDIPDSCPQLLRSLMLKCWNNCPSKRPQFSDIISTLSRFNNNTANTSK